MTVTWLFCILLIKNLKWELHLLVAFIKVGWFVFQITVFKESEEEEKGKVVFTGYLISWCNPVKASRTLLPLMLCNGKKSIRIAVLEVLCKRFDTLPKPLILMQEDIRHLSVYTLIMLGESDTTLAMLLYRIPPGDIRLMVPLTEMLKLWSQYVQIVILFKLYFIVWVNILLQINHN